MQCKKESGIECTGDGIEHDCDAICGDGLVRGIETCDPGKDAEGNVRIVDGCNNCHQVSGWECTKQDSVC